MEIKIKKDDYDCSDSYQVEIKSFFGNSYVTLLASENNRLEAIKSILKDVDGLIEVLKEIEKHFVNF